LPRPFAAAEADAGLRGLGDAVIGAVDHVLGGSGGGRQQCEVEIVAAVDGQLRDAGQINGGGLLRAFAVDDGRLGEHFNHLLELAHFEAHGQGEGVADADFDLLEDLRGKAGGFHADAVAPRRQEGEDEFSVVVRLRGALDGAVRVGRLELGAADGAAAGISDGAADFARIALRLRICWKAREGRDGQNRHRLHCTTPHVRHHG